MAKPPNYVIFPKTMRFFSHVSSSLNAMLFFSSVMLCVFNRVYVAFICTSPQAECRFTFKIKKKVPVVVVVKSAI